MKAIIYIMVGLIITVALVITTTRATCMIIAGYIEMRRIADIPYYGVKVENDFYIKKRHIIGALLEFFLLMMLYSNKEYYQVSLITTIVFTVLIVMLFLNVCTSVITCFVGKEGYLTREGIATAGGIYKKGKYKFIIEKEQTGVDGGTFIMVRDVKTKDQYRFKIIEEEEKAIKIVEDLSREEC